MTKLENCIVCNKKLKKDDSYNCWRTGCQTERGQRCGECAEFHEAKHIECGEYN